VDILGPPVRKLNVSVYNIKDIFDRRWTLKKEVV
jgi:hypothetical protein